MIGGTLLSDMNIQDFSPSPEQEIQFLLLRKIDVTFELDSIHHLGRYSNGGVAEDTLYLNSKILSEKLCRIQDRIDELLDTINSNPEVPAVARKFHSGDLVEATHDLYSGPRFLCSTGTRLVVLGSSGNVFYPISVGFEGNPSHIFAVRASDLVKVSSPNSDSGKPDRTS